jgi:hypothetical protein
MSPPSLSHPTNLPEGAPEPDSEEVVLDDEAKIRLEALRWIHQALSDIDRAIEAGRNDTAKQLLHRVQDVLHMPGVQPDSDETR